MEKMITITESDYAKLSNMINYEKRSKKEALWNLALFKASILGAEKVNSENISSRFITMNSKVKIYDMETGKTMIVEIVYPRDADYKNGKISVLSSLGSTLLGQVPGSKIYFNSSAGKKKIRIEDIIYQPEACGIFSDDAYK